MGSSRGRSFSTFNGQAMQANALKHHYNLCNIVEGSQVSDYMKCHAQLGHMSLSLQMHKDGLGHKVNPFQTYNNFINILNDLEIRMGR